MAQLGVDIGGSGVRAARIEQGRCGDIHSMPLESRSVNGVVDLDLYKGNVIIRGRSSDKDSLYDEHIATFEDDKGAYRQSDAEGFIRLNALRLRIAQRKRAS